MPDATSTNSNFEIRNPTAFQQSLIDRMRDHGPITVAEFMRLCAAEYYAHQTPFGSKGDFITAPGVSQMFGEMLAIALMRQWQEAGQPNNIRLIELGPGEGTLCEDILRTLKGFKDFTPKISLDLVETSPALREKQKQRLQDFAADISFYESLSTVAAGFSFIIANEFFDALPIHQFRKAKGLWLERCIDFNTQHKHFFFTTQPAHDEILRMMPPDFLTAQDGSIFEISPASLAVMDEISLRIKQYGGCAIVIDYGYAAPGLGDTLQCLSQHRYADTLEAPGQHDITAHVDFSTLKAVAEQHVTVEGPAGQGDFLFAMGIALRAEKLKEKADDKGRADIDRALKRLTAPDEMGQLFKVLVLRP